MAEYDLAQLWEMRCVDGGRERLPRRSARVGSQLHDESRRYFRVREESDNDDSQMKGRVYRVS